MAQEAVVDVRRRWARQGALEPGERDALAWLVEFGRTEGAVPVSESVRRALFGMKGRGWCVEIAESAVAPPTPTTYRVTVAGREVLARELRLDAAWSAMLAEAGEVLNQPVPGPRVEEREFLRYLRGVVEMRLRMRSIDGPDGDGLPSAATHRLWVVIDGLLDEDVPTEAD